MMAQDTTALRKDAIRDDAQNKSWNLYEKVRFSPVHGHTPMAPELEAAPSKAGLILGLAGSAVQGYKDFKANKAEDWRGSGGDGNAIDNSESSNPNIEQTQQTVDVGGLNLADVSKYSGVSASTRIENPYATQGL